AWFEGEDHQGTEHDNGDTWQIEGNFKANAGAISAGVVVNDCADTDGAVNHGEQELGEMPDLPERRSPFTCDQNEVQSVHTVANHHVREKVNENQNQKNRY